MKKTIFVIILILLLWLSIIVAAVDQEKSKGAPIRAAGTYPQAGKPPAQKEEEKAAPETPPVPSATRIYRYEYSDDKGKHWRVSEENPSEFGKALPEGWKSFETAWSSEYISPESAEKIIKTAQELNIPPADVYDGKAVFVKQGKTITIMDKDGTRYDYDSNGKVDEAAYRRYVRGGMELVLTEEQKAGAAELYKEASSRQSIRGVMEFFSDVAWELKQYSGMAAWSSLFFKKDFLQKWGQEVNEFFCKTIVLGGIDCWVSKICSHHSDVKPTSAGVLFSTAGPSVDAVAHIEAERSLAIETPEGKSWVYVATFALKNPLDETMRYNVRFNGPRKTATWWKEAQQLPKLFTASALGGSALIKHTTGDYNEICLEFEPAILLPYSGEKRKICNNIIQYSGPATKPYTAVTAAGAEQLCIETATGIKCGAPVQKGKAAEAPEKETPGGEI